MGLRDDNRELRRRRIRRASRSLVAKQGYEGLSMRTLARKADLWLQLRPGTDDALALSMLNVIIAERLYDEPFVAQCRKALTGSVVDSVGKPGSDRTIVLRFGNRPALVAELATHRANLVLLDARGRVVAHKIRSSQ